MGPDGLVPILLVYYALPKIGSPTDLPIQSTYQRAMDLCKATEDMPKHFAEFKISTAVRNQNGPDISDVHSAPLDLHVLV